MLSIAPSTSIPGMQSRHALHESREAREEAREAEYGMWDHHTDTDMMAAPGRRRHHRRGLTITDIGSDALAHAFTFLSSTDIARCSRVNSTFAHTVAGAAHVWKAVAAAEMAPYAALQRITAPRAAAAKHTEHSQSPESASFEVKEDEEEEEEDGGRSQLLPLATSASARCIFLHYKNTKFANYALGLRLLSWAQHGAQGPAPVHSKGTLGHADAGRKEARLSELAELLRGFISEYTAKQPQQQQRQEELGRGCLVFDIEQPAEKVTPDFLLMKELALYCANKVANTSFVLYTDPNRHDSFTGFDPVKSWREVRRWTRFDASGSRLRVSRTKQAAGYGVMPSVVFCNYCEAVFTTPWIVSRPTVLVFFRMRSPSAPQALPQWLQTIPNAPIVPVRIIPAN